MTPDEKIIRYIASKLIQRKFFLEKGMLPDEKKLAMYINLVLEILIEKYRKLKYVRIKSESGLVTPAVRQVVDNLKI